jgi:hypothetical protein
VRLRGMIEDALEHLKNSIGLWSLFMSITSIIAAPVAGSLLSSDALSFEASRSPFSSVHASSYRRRRSAAALL